MDFELDVKNEYMNFTDFLRFAYASCDDLVTNLEKFLIEYRNLKDFNKNFANELELKLLFYEKFLDDVNSILKTVEDISLIDMTVPKIEPKGWKDVALFIPRDYEQDIYVDSDFRIFWD